MRATRGLGTGVLGSLVFAALCFAAMSCGGIPEVPSRGGPRWLLLTSEHFQLYTDAPDARARELSGHLERQLHALCELGFSCSGELRVKQRVVALSDRAQFEHYFGSMYAGMAQLSVLYEPLIVLFDGSAHDSLVTLNRTLAVQLAAQAMGPLPAWLGKGLGAYFASAHYDADGAFVVGAVPLGYAQWLHQQPRVPAAQLLDPQAQLPDEAITPSAWLLVHYLMSERGSDFAAFQAAVASGKPLSESFHEAFSDLSPERLDALLDRYAENGSYLTLSKQIAAPRSEAQASALSDADVYELRAELSALCSHCDKRELDENLKLALASAPDHLRATMLRAAERPQAAAVELAAAERLTREHPDAGLAYLHLAALRGQADLPERCAPDVLGQLERLLPYNAYALALRAQCEQSHGHPELALRLSRRALALAPNLPIMLLVHAELLSAQHACAELGTLLERIDRRGLDPALLSQLSHCETH